MTAWNKINVCWKPVFEAAGIEPDDEDFVPLKLGASKVLVVCRGGNCRSVAVSFLLKYKYNCEALAASWEKNSRPTMLMLCRWANEIILVDKKYRKWIPVAFRDKIINLNIGDDKWANGLDPDLIQKVDKQLKKLYARE